MKAYISPLASKSVIVLRPESPSGKCAKLHAVAASNNRDHMPWSLYYCLFAPRIYRCCSSRASRWWGIAHSTQRQPRVCNNCNPLRTVASGTLWLKVALGALLARTVQFSGAFSIAALGAFLFGFSLHFTSAERHHSFCKQPVTNISFAAIWKIIMASY